MKRDSFSDSRGDEYLFLEYETGEIRISKETATGIHVAQLSQDAAARLREFLCGTQREMQK